MDRGIMQNSTLKLTQVSQFSSDNVKGANQGVAGVAVAGTSTNIDLKLTDDCFISGGILRANGAVFGDKATFQVVDIDNVCGYGANTVLGQYCTNWYMRSDAQQQVDENTPYPVKVLTNLYLRIIYYSVGESNVTVTVNYRLHRALY